MQRHFRAVLTDGQSVATAATIQMTGTFNLSPTGEQWRPFTLRQRATMRRPGFLWDARIAMLPGLTVRVVDSYILGNGPLKACIQGLLLRADMQGDDEIERGEFMHYFAEPSDTRRRCGPARACNGRMSMTDRRTPRWWTVPCP